MIRIRIIQSPPIASIDGIQLDCFRPGTQYEVGNSLGALFLAEKWAEPVPLDAPTPITPYSENDPFEIRVLNRRGELPNLPNLIRDTHPPSLDPDRTVAGDQWQTGRRRRKPRYPR